MDDINKIQTKINKDNNIINLNFDNIEKFEDKNNFFRLWINLKKYLENKNFQFIYIKNSNLIFKILYDKFFRPEVFSLIEKTSVHTINSQKDRFKLILFKELYFPSIELTLNDPTINEISSLKNEVTYMKLNLKFCKYFMILMISLSIFLPVALFTFSVDYFGYLKKIKYSKVYLKSKPFLSFIIMNAFLFTLILYYKIKETNRLENELELKYKRMIEKYSILS
jgi:hypothetical protein